MFYKVCKYFLNFLRFIPPTEDGWVFSLGFYKKLHVAPGHPPWPIGCRYARDSHPVSRPPGLEPYFFQCGRHVLI